MNIYAIAGDKVTFLNENGYESDREYAKLVGIKEGDILTVDYTDVGDFSSTVVFKEYPQRHFNTVMFGDTK